jgi:glyoxylase-like metal-dependent hydrolase (beta-lactamase superfamily II)
MGIGSALVRSRERTHGHVASGRAQPEVVPVVSCEVLAAGYCLQSYRFLVAGGAHKVTALAASFALLRHPRHGIILFDTGYAPRSKEAVKHWPFVLYEKLIPTTIKPEWSAKARLAQRGIGADEVRFVIVSHFHADHIGGLRDFPRATFIASGNAYARVRGLKGLKALRAAFIPELLPEDFEARSLVILPLPGHAPGQIGVLVQSGETSRTLLAADGAWTCESFRNRRMPSRLVTAIVDNWRATRGTLGRLHAVHRTEPEVSIVPCHCPEYHSDALKGMGVPGRLRW